MSKRIIKSSSNDELKLKYEVPIPPLPPLQLPKLLIQNMKYPSLSRKTTVSSLKFLSNYKNLFLNLNEKKYSELPKPINTLTAKKQYHNTTINEREFSHDINKKEITKNINHLLYDGHLNVFVHYSCIDKKFFNANENKKFYVVLRVDQQPYACTAVCLQNDAKLAQSYFILDFNQQFIVNLSSDRQFDFVICSQVRKLLNISLDDSSVIGKCDDDDDDELINTEDLFFSFKFDFDGLFSTRKQINWKLCLHLKRFTNNETTVGNQMSFVNMSIDNNRISNNNEQQTDAYLYVTLSYLKEFSIINQLFSNKLNSKLIATAQVDNKNCKFHFVLRKLINEIETRGGLYEPYLYQLHVCLSDIKWTLLQLERDCIDIIHNMPDIHVISSKLNAI